MQYSGGGTAVIRKIIEDNIDTDYAGLYQKMVLTPLKMTHSTFVQPLPASMAPNAATAYDGAGKPLKGRYHTYPEVSPDGLWTTPSDLATYAIALQQSLDSAKRSFLKPATVREMLMPFSEQQQVGYGFFITATKREKFFGHGGSNDGFRCALYAGETNHQGVAVMVNSDNGAIIGEIVNAVAEVYGWKDFYQPVIRKVITPSADSIAAYAGKYSIKAIGINLEIALKNGVPGLIRSDRPIWEQLYFTDESQFFILSEGFDLRFVRAEGGKVTGIGVRNGGQAFTAQRISAE